MREKIADTTFISLGINVWTIITASLLGRTKLLNNTANGFMNMYTNVYYSSCHVHKCILELERPYLGRA